ncbi:adenosylmethionine--8-amino-7-oxononanoate transaminase [Moraxella haemolytica]|uniref:adenosylmethionine--8-amino-7-oxononanoate transaminase n=1 Tax=Moraxella haemolytica TaxID=2904119 RepID=UPI0025431694|nr:adenosylmethionine--8-amino-7-oxononanoate transaminase [Moraxella sp. ZY171148]WII95517.1 adenosylmethionine--8-amino-7-oxononanoate transaminase [Moraxella sp. ZY171148]
MNLYDLTNPDILDQLTTFDRTHLWHPYASLPPSYDNHLISHANGVRLYMADGTSLIDGMSSWWASIHGYNHPILNQAVTEQIGKMSHVMFGGLTHTPAIELGQKLLGITPKNLTKIFYADSGSVAVEVALKMALQYQMARGTPHKNAFGSTHSGYHGDTWHAMSVCDPVNSMHTLYGSQLPVQYFLPAPPMGFDTPLDDDTRLQMDNFFGRYHDKLAGFIIEPIVQGAGGMRFYSPQYLAHLHALCQYYDVLLICDEIATGFGRSGQMFAVSHANICPDIMTLGKALTGGYMSFGAVMSTAKIADTLHNSPYPALMHGPTFMGNPLACAIASASIDLVWQHDSAYVAQKMQNKLNTHLQQLISWKEVYDVRVLGAIAVIEMKQMIDMPTFQRLLPKYGIWVRPFGKLVYLMPAYIISDEDLKMLCANLIKLLHEYFNHQR